MSRWAAWYACTKDIADHALFVLETLDADRDEEDSYDSLHEEVFRDFPDALPSCAIDYTWEDIHRCLTGDKTRSLDFARGDHPLKLCVHGGEWLRDAPESVTLVSAEQIPALCRALEAIDREWIRKRLWATSHSLEQYEPFEPKQRLVDEVWGEFCGLRHFYLAAEKLNVPVICTISH